MLTKRGVNEGKDSEGGGKMRYRGEWGRKIRKEETII